MHYYVEDIKPNEEMDVIIPSEYRGQRVDGFKPSTKISKDSKIRYLTTPETFKKIDSYVFYEHENIKGLTVSKGTAFIGASSFYSCHLTFVNLPSTLTTIGEYAFCGTDITRVDIPSTVTDIGRGAFSGCLYLEDITYSGYEKNFYVVDGVLYEDKTDKILAFPCGRTGTIKLSEYCKTIYSFDIKSTKATSIEFPKKITKIPDRLMSYATNLESVIIYNKVASIGDNAFGICNNLKTIYFYGTQEEWNNIKIDKTKNKPIAEAEVVFMSTT